MFAEINFELYCAYYEPSVFTIYNFVWGNPFLMQ